MSKDADRAVAKNEAAARRERLRAYKSERWRIVHGHELAQVAWLAKIERGEWAPQPEPPVIPPMPADLLELRCGATTRVGAPCKQKEIFANGRCKYHGGLSTGPRTPAGRTRAIGNLRRGREAGPGGDLRTL